MGVFVFGVPEGITSIPKWSITGRRNVGLGWEASAWEVVVGEMEGGDCREEGLVIRADETAGGTFEKQINRVAALAKAAGRS